jgi:hypothetical protein
MLRTPTSATHELQRRRGSDVGSRCRTRSIRSLDYRSAFDDEPPHQQQLPDAREPPCCVGSCYASPSLDRPVSIRRTLRGPQRAVSSRWGEDDGPSPRPPVAPVRRQHQQHQHLRLCWEGGHGSVQDARGTGRAVDRPRPPQKDVAVGNAR